MAIFRTKRAEREKSFIFRGFYVFLCRQFFCQCVLRALRGATRKRTMSVKLCLLCLFFLFSDRLRLLQL